MPTIMDGRVQHHGDNVADAEGKHRGSDKRKRDDDDEGEASKVPSEDQDDVSAAPPGDSLDNDDDDEDFSAMTSEADNHMRLLLDSMSEEQRDRYEVVRRSRFLPSEMRRFLAHIGVTPPPKQLLIILGSVAKIYAGELVEEARDEMLRRGENTAIQPRHLRLAARKLKAQGKIPSSENTHPTKFRR
eukprot:m.173495 g.173495  ORF g.173495 m.173495 type:complete len:187 (+) comp18303_c0_seq1:345-905(+)